MMCETKQCRRCGLVKPVEMFSPTNKGPGSRQPYCKPCRSAYVNQSRKVMRRNRKAREEIWPRPITEQLLDLKVRNWRYPATTGQLTWRV